MIRSHHAPQQGVTTTHDDMTCVHHAPQQGVMVSTTPKSRTTRLAAPKVWAGALPSNGACTELAATCLCSACAPCPSQPRRSAQGHPRDYLCEPKVGE